MGPKESSDRCQGDTGSFESLLLVYRFRLEQCSTSAAVKNGARDGCDMRTGEDRAGL